MYSCLNSIKRVVQFRPLLVFYDSSSVVNCVICAFQNERIASRVRGELNFDFPSCSGGNVSH